MYECKPLAPGKSASTGPGPASIVNVASAGGFFPMPMAPVYSATKVGALALFNFSAQLEHLVLLERGKTTLRIPQRVFMLSWKCHVELRSVMLS